ncbi:MAG TPA: large conductance mechanosensitive channel protein MscL [Parasegetibacter sp.]|jgi:large conductance mechanosensitive channel
MGMIKEFKQFALKGNVIDLAVAVVIGAAFNKIISSLIDDVVTPLLLKPALEAANLSKLEELTIFGTVKYGTFVSAIINFLIVAFILFLLVKLVNKAKREKAEEVAAEPPAPSATEVLLMEIRDELKKK